MKVYLRRFFRKNVAVFGMLQFEDFSLFTIENFIKIIPEGTYKVNYTYSPKFSKKPPYREYEGVPVLMNVPGRSGIRIHCGNYWNDAEGCIIVGNGMNIEKTMLNDSRAAYRKMMDYLKNCHLDGFELKVYEDYAINN